MVKQTGDPADKHGLRNVTFYIYKTDEEQSVQGWIAP